MTRRVKGLSALPYWERLDKMNLLSTERRQEQYQIIYTWKALKGLVPPCGISLAPASNTRSGQLALVPCLSGTRAAVQSLRDRHLNIEGPRLYNLIPVVLRDLSLTLESFKAGLDQWILACPDCPATGGRHHPATDQWGQGSRNSKTSNLGLLDQKPSKLASNSDVKPVNVS